MARVVVTGGSGKLGRACVDDLLRHGYDVVVLDIVPPQERRCPFTLIDFGDYGQTIEAFSEIEGRYKGVDAIVHLAAIPGPGIRANAHTFHNNIVCAYNVFAAARKAGVKNLVWAASETVLGVPFDTPPLYLPLDEDSPVRPETAYALAKSLEEEMARHSCRWDPEFKMVGLRFSYVKETSEYAGFPALDADPMLQRWNLWSYIDARDGAQAVRLALEHPAKGMDVFIIASPDTVMRRSTSELLAEVYPDVPVRKHLGHHESLLSTEKARRLLGYAPQHSWRDS
jgi:nucleoside-diphosphate-sugar epimerase